ncbi:MAG: hypothetical protein ACJ72W_00090 [Actinoallomurus sp.]
MKLTLKAEVTQPSWLAPAAHVMISGGGLTYLQHGGGGVMATAVTLAVGMSYGHLLAERTQTKTVSGKGRR